jgi:uncharacterized repeat protein (TIGR03803 family)
MMDRNELRGSILISRSQLSITLLLTLLLGPLIVAAQEPASGHFRVIHNFTGKKDGGIPYAGLIIDQSGNLYGIAFLGGRGTCPPENIGCGTVFEMTPSASGWIFKTLYAFLGNNDGAGPYAPVAIGPDGSLYGTTNQGGNQSCLSGCGVVFRVKPTTTACPSCAWTESVLYRFQGGADGFYPLSNVAFDKAGNLYGTTEQGGAGNYGGAGTVWELTPSNRGWTKSILYNFYNDGGPYSGVMFDHGGNIWGTTYLSNGFYGGVYQLHQSGSGWTEKSIYSFQGGNHGGGPTALILGKSGELIGATNFGGRKGNGTVYSLSSSKGRWTLATLYNFAGPGSGPWAQPTMDAAGNLYGTTWGGSNGEEGTVFKLTHSSSGWKQTVLHRFTGGSDGGIPYSAIVFDSHGNLYGTASNGGAFNQGVVFEITP